MRHLGAVLSLLAFTVAGSWTPCGQVCCPTENALSAIPAIASTDCCGASLQPPCQPVLRVRTALVRPEGPSTASSVSLSRVMFPVFLEKGLPIGHGTGDLPPRASARDLSLLHSQLLI
jgi:hypothetical protein